MFRDPSVEGGMQATFRCGKTHLDQLVGKRVASGQVARPGEFPWQVKLRSFGTVFCAGVLVHPRFVLTAARCFRNNYNPQLWSVVLGDLDSGTKHIVHVDTIFIHGSFQIDPYRNDVAVVKLVTYKRRDDFQLICLPEKHGNFSRLPCVLTGWGAVNRESFFSQTLQKQAVSILEPEDCGHHNSSLDPSLYLCASSQTGGGPCQGDTGGPIVCRTKMGTWEIAGLVYEEFGCQRYPPDRGLYTNIAAYAEWIEKMISKKL
ncbi:serine protease 30-like [Gigantopelta aegis]|uniref:serine protease 30-like n=1 Tax=Gigantopelta aegis TaxID=1735272 RepID=UPI001B88E45F|nr:serine protease 30-like [Gigantopelta aegis]